jgi:endonuclease VIII
VPEGHTLHRLARDHQAWFAGRPVAVSSPQGRFTGAALVDGRTLDRAEAHGKHLFHHYDGAATVHVHLGLFGKFTATGAPAPPPRPTVRMRLATDTHTVDLAGATVCELIGPDEVAAIRARLGPDPLRRDAAPERGYRALQRRSVGIGRALMDQKVLAGVGNVYRAEVLFVHGIHPETPATAITHEEWQSIWDTLVAWMRYGVRSGRIVTADPAEVGRTRSRMRGDERVHVYRRDHCARCGTAVRRWDLAGRWAYACESCQPVRGVRP